MALPILMLDEHALSPRFGYVFDPAWLDPYESILGMLWKFVRANRLAAAVLVAQIGTRPADGYEGLRPCEPDVDVRAVGRLLGIPRSRVSTGMLSQGPALADPAWCATCLNAGYHGVVHQQPRNTRCPVHGGALQRRCGSCGRPSAYCLDAQLLDTPYRCRHCRARLSSNAGWSWGCRRTLRAKDRMALTRARWA